MDQLTDDYADKTFYTTQLVDQTHYLIAPEGEDHANFLQLEIKNLQETHSHQLFTNDPTNVENLIDPREGKENPQPLNLPFYTFPTSGFIA